MPIKFSTINSNAEIGRCRYVGFINSQKRSIEAFERFQDLPATKTFMTSPNGMDTSNHPYFSSSKTTIGCGQFVDQVNSILWDFLRSDETDSTLVIDISCLDVFHIGYWVQVISRLDEQGVNKRFCFGYFPGRVHRETSSKSLLRVKPVNQFWAGEVILDGKPSAALIGCGSETNLAYGCFEELEPSAAVFFRSAMDGGDAHNVVSQANVTVLNELTTSGEGISLVEYPLANPLEQLRLIQLQLNKFEPFFRPILVPQGPGIFTACVFFSALLTDGRFPVYRPIVFDDQAVNDQTIGDSFIGLVVETII